MKETERMGLDPLGQCQRIPVPLMFRDHAVEELEPVVSAGMRFVRLWFWHEYLWVVAMEDAGQRQP